MSALNAYVRRIFGGKSGDAEEGARRYNAQNQVDGETLGVATHSRMFKGPQRNGNWSYQGKAVTAFGASSTLKFYYSDLPNPDPTVAAHWVDSGITALDLTSTATFFATVTGKFPEWIKAEVVGQTSGGTFYLWVRSEGVEV
jgi:hypothetical protein